MFADAENDPWEGGPTLGDERAVGSHADADPPCER